MTAKTGNQAWKEYQDRNHRAMQRWVRNEDYDVDIDLLQSDLMAWFDVVALDEHAAAFLDDGRLPGDER